MKIDFELTESDLAEYFRYSLRTNPTIRRSRLINRGIVLLALGFIAIGSWISMFMYTDTAAALKSTTNWSLPIASSLCLFVYLFFILYEKKTLPGRMVRKQIKKGFAKSILGRISVELTQTHLSIAHPASDTLIRWHAFHQLVTTEKALYCFVDESSAHIIPRHAFQDDAAFQEFIQQVRQYREQGPSVELKCPECSYDLTGIVIEGCPECGWHREADNA